MPTFKPHYCSGYMSLFSATDFEKLVNKPRKNCCYQQLTNDLRVNGITRQTEQNKLSSQPIK